MPSAADHRQRHRKFARALFLRVGFQFLDPAKNSRSPDSGFALEFVINYAPLSTCLVIDAGAMDLVAAANQER